MFVCLSWKFGCNFDFFDFEVMMNSVSFMWVIFMIEIIWVVQICDGHIQWASSDLEYIKILRTNHWFEVVLWLAAGKLKIAEFL